MYSALVVDDSRAMRMLLTMALERIPGVTVFTAEDGAEALEIARRASHLDLVFTDVNMPVLNGLRLLDELQFLPSARKASIVVVTSEAEDEAKARSRGAKEYLLKPVRAPQILGVAREMLGLS